MSAPPAPWASCAARWPFFANHGIHVQALMTDNGSAYISVAHALACRALGLRHLRTRRRRPQTNGKVERLIRTMLSEWAPGAIYASSTERTAALAGWLMRYNHHRPHGALGHRPPHSSAWRAAQQRFWVLQPAGQPAWRCPESSRRDGRRGRGAPRPSITTCR
jgi:transposase InsO family protein